MKSKGKDYKDSRQRQLTIFSEGMMSLLILMQYAILITYID